jgi:hypothetical protein
MCILVLGTYVGKLYSSSTLVLLAVGMDPPTGVYFNSIHTLLQRVVKPALTECVKVQVQIKLSYTALEKMLHFHSCIQQI